MNRWFRMYSDAMRNPKVVALSDRDFRTWVGLLGIASENNGHLPHKEALRTLLMMRLDHLSLALDRLSKAGLIDVLASGYEPHNWRKFQYKSDTSRERVTLHRARRVTQPVTAPEADTETDTDTEKKVAGDGYVFAGRTIKLNAADLERWRGAFSAIPDLEAELHSIDAWFERHPAKRATWFQSTSGMLNRKHQELRQLSMNNGMGAGHSGIPI